MSDAGGAGSAGGSTGSAGSTSGSQGSSSASNSAPTQSGSTSGSQNPGNSAQNPGNNASSHGNQQAGQANPAGETAAERQERLLSEQDLDAFVEQTVNGKKERIKVRDLQKAYGLDKAAQQKMEAAALERKRAQAELQRVQNMSIDEFAQMRKLNLDQLSEERLAKRYELESMSPEQRQAHENAQKLAEYQKMELSSKRQLAKQIEEVTGEKLTDEQLSAVDKDRMIKYLQKAKTDEVNERQNLEKEFVAAWEEQKLPKHPKWGRLIAHEMYVDMARRKAAAAKGEPIDGDPLQAKDAAAKVKTDWFKESREIAGQMDAKAIQEWLGKDIMKKILDYEVERVTGKASFQQNGPGNSAPASPKPKEPMNEHEWREYMKRSA